LLAHLELRLRFCEFLGESHSVGLKVDALVVEGNLKDGSWCFGRLES
jgi:hypothetical protein